MKRMMLEGEVRKYLSKFLFFGEDVFKKVAALSGGEKSRLIMAKITMSGANTLILDEPTNHLDIESKEMLEEALVNFDGTIIFVSHDRYFIDKVASGLISLENMSIKYYGGNYSFYKEKRLQAEAADVPQRAKKASEPVKASDDMQPAKALSKNAERMLKAELEKLETEIAGCEVNIKNYESVFADGALEGKPLSFAEIEKLNKEYDLEKKRCDGLYEKWHEISARLE